jgi:hypothetical protein
MQREPQRFFACAVAVSSFRPNSRTEVAVGGALWSMHNGWGNSAGLTNAIFGDFALRLGVFNMTPDILTFGFSGDTGAANDLFSKLDLKADSGQGIVAPTFICNAYICKINDDAYISAHGDFASVGFTFDGSIWHYISDVETKIQWPA